MFCLLYGDILYMYTVYVNVVLVYGNKKCVLGYRELSFTVVLKLNRG